MAVKAELDRDPDVLAVGINCLNEHVFDTPVPRLERPL
jgi:hypothetical protein